MWNECRVGALMVCCALVLAIVGCGDDEGSTAVEPWKTKTWIVSSLTRYDSAPLAAPGTNATHIWTIRIQGNGITERTNEPRGKLSAATMATLASLDTATLRASYVAGLMSADALETTLRQNAAQQYPAIAVSLQIRHYEQTYGLNPKEIVDTASSLPVVGMALVSSEQQLVVDQRTELSTLLETIRQVEVTSD